MNNNDVVTRYELKFYLKRKEAELLTAQLGELFETDPYSPYEVISVYFDSNDNQALIEKLGGDPIRQKYRLRSYRGFKCYKLEIKERLWHKIRKISWFIPEEIAHCLVEGEMEPVLEYTKNDLDLSLFIWHRFYNVVRPVIGTYYWRKAWQWPFNQVRVTIDENIGGFYNFQTIFDDNNPVLSKDVLPSDLVVLEIKFNNFFPETYLSVFHSLPKVYSSISKYVFCCLGANDVTF